MAKCNWIVVKLSQCVGVERTKKILVLMKTCVNDMWIISTIVLGFWTTIEIDNFDILANRIFVKMVRNKRFWNHQRGSLKTLMIYQIYLKNIWRFSIVSTHVSTQHSSFRINTLHFGGYIINTKNQKFSFSFHSIYRAKRGTCLISNPFSNTPNMFP